MKELTKKVKIRMIAEQLYIKDSGSFKELIDDIGDWTDERIDVFFETEFGSEGIKEVIK